MVANLSDAAGALDRLVLGVRPNDIVAWLIWQTCQKNWVNNSSVNGAAMLNATGTESDECRNARLSFRIVRGKVHEHADAPHFLALLRARRERPRCSRAAEAG
jgi:hypothetical protein